VLAEHVEIAKFVSVSLSVANSFMSSKFFYCLIAPSVNELNTVMKF